MSKKKNYRKIINEASPMSDEGSLFEDEERKITFADNKEREKNDEARLMEIANKAAGIGMPSNKESSVPSVTSPDISASGSPLRKINRSPWLAQPSSPDSPDKGDKRNSEVSECHSPSPETVSTRPPRQSSSPLTRDSERIPAAKMNSDFIVEMKPAPGRTKKIHPQIRESYENLRDGILRKSKNKSKMNPTVSKSVDVDLMTSRNQRLTAQPSRVTQMIHSREQSRASMDNRIEFSSDDSDGGKDSDTAKSRPRPYQGGGTGNLFKTEVEEILFKSMKKIRPKSAGSTSTSLSSRSHAGGRSGPGGGLSQGSMASMGTIQTTGTKGTTKSGFSCSTRGGGLTTQSYAAMTASIDRLTGSSTAKYAAKSTSSKNIYASYDERKNCTFKPKIRRRAQDRQDSGGSSDEGESKAKADSSKAAFMDRQAQDDRRRRNAVEQRRGKEAYDALVDKKFCPRCTAKRSYDEYKDKKKRCSNCNVEFTSKVVWTTKTGANFFKRDEEFLKLKDEHVEKLREEVLSDLRSYESRAYDEETGKLVSTRQNLFSGELKWDEETRAEFEERLESCNQKKAERFEKIVAEMTYSFAPTLTLRKKKSGDDDDDEEEDDEGGGKRNVVRQFMERLERDNEKYRQTHPPVPKVVKNDTYPRFVL